MVLKLKITFNGDVRRLRAVPRDFASLCVEAFKTHEIPLQDRTNLVLKYIDDEGDFITLSSTRDFEEALALAREERRKSLKLFVFDKAAVAAEHLAATRINGAASFMSESVATASVAGGRLGSLASGGGVGVAPVVSPASDSSFPPLAPPTLAEKVAAPVAPIPAPEETATATEEPPKPQATETGDAKKDDSEPAKPAGCGGIRQKLIDFIRDPKVQAELPDAVLVWFATLREELNAAAANPTANGEGTAGAAKGAIVKAFDTVLETFESLGSNELIKKARRHVERLAEKAAPFVPFVVSLDENQVVGHVRKILEMVNARLNGENGDDFSCDALRGMLPPGIGAFLPMAGAYFGGGFPGAAGAEGASPFGGSFFDLFGPAMNPDEDEDDDEEDEDDEDEEATPKEDPAPETDANGNVIHYGVECDGCKVSPIVGARFKCYTCPDFDLCAKCEKTMDPLQFFGTGHKIEHMMTKYRKPRVGAGERAAHAHARGSRRFGGGSGRCGRNRFGGRRHHHGHGFGGARHHGFGGGRHHGFGGRRGGWWRGGNQQQQQQGMPDFSQMGPFGAMLGNMMGGAAAGQQGAAGANPFAAMFGGGANPAGAGAGATPFDPRAFEQMMGGMFGAGGANGGRCGGFGGRHGGRWGGRRGKKGQRGPYNAEIVIAADVTGAEQPSGCRRRRRETKQVTLDNASYTFTIKNTGEAEWPAGTRVVYTRHDRIGAMEIDLPLAKPGESVEVTIPLSVDELTVGERYHSVYRLKLPIDTHRPPRKFGDPLHIRVEVVATADAEAAKAEGAEVAKPRKVSALSPPEGLDEEEETKDYDPPQAKKDEEVVKGKLEPLAAEVAAAKPAEAAAPATAPLAPAAAGGANEYAEKLQLLAGMGFPQESLNEWCLRENDGNVQKAALQLVQLYNSKE